MIEDRTAPAFSLEAFLYSLGVTRKNPYWDDCLQEARIALYTSCKEGDAQAYARQAVKWAVFNYLNKQLREDTRAFRLRVLYDQTPLEDIVVERLAREAEYRRRTLELTPLERMAWVLSVYSPLSRKQIAHTLDISERSLRRNVSEANSKLKAQSRQRAARRKAYKKEKKARKEEGC